MFCNKPFLEGQMSKDEPTPTPLFARKKHSFFRNFNFLKCTTTTKFFQVIVSVPNNNHWAILCFQYNTCYVEYYA